MLVHDGFMAQDASLQCSETRPKSGVLTPASDASSHSHNGSQVISRKRKRDPVENGGGLEELLSERFTVKPHPSSVHDRPRSFKPIALLSRSDFPLSSLDRSRPAASALPDSRLYESHVKILELEQRMGSTPVVLIAQLDDNKALYAVEYESKGLYVLFKLGSWVDLSKLCSVAVVSRPYTKSHKHDNPQGVAGRGASANNALSPAESDKYSKKKRLAIEAIQSMVKRPSTSQSLNIEQTTSTESPSTALPLEPIQIAQLDPVAAVQPSQDAPLEEPRAEDILDGVRSQYLDTLYLSKVSTAYFAKGPLSRARAAFHLDLDSTLQMKDLTQFLDSLVLPTNILDKKYKDGLQEFVSTLDPGMESDLDADAKTRPKKRKIKKVKLGKNGLYNTEDSFIKSWWGNHDVDAETPGAAREGTARSRISKLRVREILLQIILILETLALQKLCPPPDPTDDLPLPAVAEGTPGDKTPRSKAKKPRDLSALVAVHLDRLSIWSLSAGEGTSTSKQGPTSSAPNLTTTSGSDATDILRNFCLEVVVPFFSARLPSLCDTICRKLGGPRVSSPARPPLRKSSSMSATAPSRPSAVSKKSAVTESRRSLQRALTDEKLQARSKSRRPSVAVSLLRSATAPVLPPTLKREGSEAASLSSIPTINSQSQHASRTAAHKARKPSQTENGMGLGAPPDRQSKKANIEAELKYAISVLKKPNRQLAGQTTVDLAEKRALASASQSRKAKKPTRNPGFENMRPTGVQILATPKKPRSQNMGPGSQMFSQYQAEPELEPSFVPPSSISRVSSSGYRQAVPDSSPPLYRSAPVSREQYQSSVVNATPTRSSRQTKLDYGVSVVDTTPVRVTSAYYGNLGATNQTGVVADTPVRTSMAASDNFKNLFAAPKPRRELEIPPSPSPPRAPRSSTIDGFLRVPPEPYRENISETPRKSPPILCTPVKTRTEPQNEAVRPRSPLKPLNFSAASSRFEEGSSSLLESKAVKPAAAAADDGDIYKSLGWDDDDL
ncbi:hypothetical protein VE01_00230 [Pseudogymnoascus verrucosus]|uniref:DNA replication regulator Sld3 C-terminal domain-containing protein n=1 Tax=Pseudogymnoascus verrucosus TaxID=342668 RepID=A0A2P2SWZ9_9PEZI|nr:uncharacterized protein VE01_00230 [Pseudogymnoascus verrucosus]OBU01374.1 hypothetical protein VE01_00230 [Pseudogymnoascus verrucosus]